MGIQSLIFISSDVFTKHNFQTQISIKSDSHTCTGYSLSESLILASINPKYDEKLFVELQFQYKKTTSSAYVVYCIKIIFCFCLTFTTIWCTVQTEHVHVLNL